MCVCTVSLTVWHDEVIADFSLWRPNDAGSMFMLEADTTVIIPLTSFKMTKTSSQTFNNSNSVFDCTGGFCLFQATATGRLCAILLFVLVHYGDEPSAL